jgi:hypothetical protein
VQPEALRGEQRSPGAVSAPVLAYGPRARSSYVIDNLADPDRIAVREPVSPGSYLGDSLISRLPHAIGEQVVRSPRRLMGW